MVAPPFLGIDDVNIRVLGKGGEESPGSKPTPNGL